MDLITSEQRRLLLANGRLQQERQGDYDPYPVVKLFTQMGPVPGCSANSIPMTTISPSAYAISAWVSRSLAPSDLRTRIRARRHRTGDRARSALGAARHSPGLRLGRPQGRPHRAACRGRRAMSDLRDTYSLAAPNVGRLKRSSST